MERGSSKHSPRLDDEMSQEIRGTVQGVNDGRAEEWHEAEPPGEDQPDAAEIPGGGFQPVRQVHRAFRDAR
jgi:hypothetical protein